MVIWSKALESKSTFTRRAYFAKHCYNFTSCADHPLSLHLAADNNRYSSVLNHDHER